jgi:hypothetical protein
MIRWNNPITTKKDNYDVTVSRRLPVAFSDREHSLGAVRTVPTSRDRKLLGLLGQAVAYYTSITLALAAIALLFALAPSLTGQGQEAQGGQWRGAKLAAREARP